MDGHTEKGSYKVTLELTKDMVDQLTRLLSLAKMMNGRDIDTGHRPETMDIIAYRTFLEEITRILYKSINGGALKLGKKRDKKKTPPGS